MPYFETSRHNTGTHGVVSRPLVKENEDSEFKVELFEEHHCYLNVYLLSFYLNVFTLLPFEKQNRL